MRQLALLLIVFLWVHLLVQKSDTPVKEDENHLCGQSRQIAWKPMRFPDHVAYNVESDGSTAQSASGPAEDAGFCPYDPGG